MIGIAILLLIIIIIVIVIVLLLLYGSAVILEISGRKLRTGMVTVEELLIVLLIVFH